MNEAARRRVLKEVNRLPGPVVAHISQVVSMSVGLASRHGLDASKAETAAQLHDICRVTSGTDLIRMARGFELPVTALDEAFPVFVHGPVGAEVLRRDYGIDDTQILDPIRFHTMGRGGMTPQDKVLFLADKMDPKKVSRYPFIGEVQRLAEEDLDAAMLCFIDNQVKAFLDHGDPVHPGMIEARNDCLPNPRGR